MARLTFLLLTISALLFISVLPLQAQPTEHENVYTSVEQMPIFPGGDAGLADFIRDHITIPEAAKEAAVNGRIFISFTVTKTGAVEDIKIDKGVGYGIDEEAIRVISTLPQFTPGRQNGQAVKVRYVWPIKIAYGTVKTARSQQLDPSVKQPEFPGGQRALHQYLHDHTRFSQDTRDLATPLNTLYSVYVSPTGQVTNVQIINGMGFGINEALQEAMKKLPAWIPAQKDGRPVGMRIELPVTLERKGRTPVEVAVPEAK